MPLDNKTFHGIADSFMEFIKENVPQGIGVLFAFASDPERIGVVLGGLPADSDAYDAMLTKLGANIDGKRHFNVNSSVNETIQRKPLGN